MNEQMIEVMRRRSELLAKIGSQREQLAAIGARWQPVLQLADQGLSAVRFLRSNPVLAGGLVALWVARRRGVLALARGGWRAWQGYRYLAVFAARLRPRFQGTSGRDQGL